MFSISSISSKQSICTNNFHDQNMFLYFLTFSSIFSRGKYVFIVIFPDDTLVKNWQYFKPSSISAIFLKPCCLHLIKLSGVAGIQMVFRNIQYTFFSFELMVFSKKSIKSIQVHLIHDQFLILSLHQLLKAFLGNNIFST